MPAWLRWALIGSVLCVALATGKWAAAAENEVDDDEEESPAGLIMRFERPEGTPVRRVESRVALAGRWSSIDRRIPDDARVRAVWTGRLKSQTPGSYRLLVHARGHIRLHLRGEVVLDETFAQPGWASSPPIDLPYEQHPFEVEYTGTEAGAQLALFWIGPDFGLEPVGPRQFSHAFDKSVDRDRFARGESLVRSLRCAACHAIRSETPLPAPALDRLSGVLRREWLVAQLTGDPPSAKTDPARATTNGLARRMPHVGLSRDEASAIAAFLLAPKNAPPLFKPDNEEPRATPSAAPVPKAKPEAKPSKATPRTGPDTKLGERLVWTVGCIACHSLDDSQPAQPFDGGDLRHIATKRPAKFFAHWLADPSTLNSDRRMPEFELTRFEREDIAAYLLTLGPTTSATTPNNSGPRPATKANASSPADDASVAASDELVAQGRELFIGQRCVACHRGPGSLAPQPSGRSGALGPESRWAGTCLGEPDATQQRPGYRLEKTDADAVRVFLEAIAVGPAPRGRRQLPADVLVQERGCVACHARDERPGIAARLAPVARRFDELAPLLPAMTPPPLTSVGDKLHDQALAGAITRLSGVHRPYLLVRMPRFRMTAQELDALVAGFAAADRIPDGAPLPAHPNAAAAATGELPETLIRAAGGRLVTPDGFGCTSCHAVGKVEAPPGPLAARGPNLSKLETRIRRSWYDRWVRNPARMVPRMEMPSVQIAVRGVLGDRIDRQLDAVWHVLNLPDFEPPEPNPIQTLRRSGIAEDRQPAAVVTDVVQADGRPWIKPLLVGMPNRHNILFDFETNRLVRWSIGDVARQRSLGKSWYWEAAGTDLLKSTLGGSELVLVGRDGPVEPVVVGQFPTEPDAWRHLVTGGLELEYRLRFVDDSERPQVVRLRQSWIPQFAAADGASGFERRVVAEGLSAGGTLWLRLASSDQWATGRTSDDRRTWSARSSDMRLSLQTDNSKFTTDGSVALVADRSMPGRSSIELVYLTTQVVDRFLPLPAPKPAVVAVVDRLDVVPGFAVLRLPVPADQMPTAFAWRPNGQLLVASLKGRVLIARDTDGDGFDDVLQPLSDELAAPYGLAATDKYVDVTTKFGVLRLHDEDRDGWAERTEVVASGWGHTADYHDWTTGLPRDDEGNYYVGLACQQDQRSAAAAALRGTVVKLVPRSPTPDEPRRFDLQVLSGGHRFPTGVARNRDGVLVVTDNQGNYNPFNELNHIRPGLRFGFINAIEQKPDFKPVLEEPAINIPHPWTRSVNGIAFLETPSSLRANLGHDAFGPFEGHLIGCEYDTRRLIRLSLQRVGDTYQGAAYPFSVSNPDPAQDLLGPLCVAVGPNGDVLVGGIRDSGWGGGNNIGEIVRLRFEPQRLPAGIAVVRALGGKLEIDFTRAIDADRARQASNFSVESYRRVSTPAYGGPDQERRAETVRGVELSADARRATLDIGPLRAGFVYELRLKPLVDAPVFFPAEAYLTIRPAL